MTVHRRTAWLLTLAGCAATPPPVSVPVATETETHDEPAPIPELEGVLAVPAGGIDPFRMLGDAGGSVAAGPWGEACRGYVADAPALSLQVAAAQDVAVAATSPSGIDIALAVRGPGGEVLCNDDFVERDPLVRGELAAGTWTIHVGTYEPNRSAPFELAVTRGEAGASTLHAMRGSDAPRLGEAPVLVAPAPGASPEILEGHAGGRHSLAAMGPGCSGYGQEEATVRIRVTAEQPLTVVATADVDLALLLRPTAGGAPRCDDDGAGDTNPALTATLPRGEYDVWVGTYAAHGVTRFRLAIGPDREAALTAARRAAPTSAPRN